MSGGLYLGSVTVNNELDSVVYGVDPNGLSKPISTTQVGTEYYLNTYGTTTTTLGKTAGTILGADGTLANMAEGIGGNFVIPMAGYKRATFFGTAIVPSAGTTSTSKVLKITNSIVGTTGSTTSWYDSSLGGISFEKDTPGSTVAFSRDYETAAPYISLYYKGVVGDTVGLTGTIHYALSA